MRTIVIAVAAALRALVLAACGGTEESAFTENERSIEAEAGDRYYVFGAVGAGATELGLPYCYRGCSGAEGAA
jgi:hypothetical protein